ncbi:dUTP pyrophosphatase [Desulfovibrionales bacterium]
MSKTYETSYLDKAYQNPYGFLEIVVKVRFLRDAMNPYHLTPEEHTLGYATPDSAGVDLKACIVEQTEIPANSRLAIPTGIAVESLTPGVVGLVFSRSGLGTKEGLVVSQGVGVIDPDYRGEIIVSLLNISAEPHTVQHGQRIAQLVFLPFFRALLLPAEKLSFTTRDIGGFGHTGTK